MMSDLTWRGDFWIPGKDLSCFHCRALVFISPYSERNTRGLNAGQKNEKNKKTGKEKKKSHRLCVLISPDTCYMLQQRAGALKLSPEILGDLPTPPVNSVAQKSIVLWDNCRAEWGRLSRGGWLGQSPSDHSRGLNSFMVHQGLLVPQKVSWSFFFHWGQMVSFFEGLPNARFSTCKTPGKMT